MSDGDGKVRVKHVLNTVKGMQQWMGHVHSALSSLDPEMELSVAGDSPLKPSAGKKKNDGECPPPEAWGGKKKNDGECPPPEIDD